MKKENKYINKLIKLAKDASQKSFCPLSKFPVGAAILTGSGKIYTGCNIEFANYTNTIHAEECAIGNAFSLGETQLIMICVYTKSNDICFPCGLCLQSLHELGGNNLIVIACNDNTFKIKNMKELLPYSFGIKNIIFNT